MVSANSSREVGLFCRRVAITSTSGANAKAFGAASSVRGCASVRNEVRLRRSRCTMCSTKVNDASDTQDDALQHRDRSSHRRDACRATTCTMPHSRRAIIASRGPIAYSSERFRCSVETNHPFALHTHLDTRSPAFHHGDACVVQRDASPNVDITSSPRAVRFGATAGTVGSSPRAMRDECLSGRLAERLHRRIERALHRFEPSLHLHGGVASSNQRCASSQCVVASRP
jgi:hypothetical protein